MDGASRGMLAVHAAASPLPPKRDTAWQRMMHLRALHAGLSTAHSR